MNLKEQKYIVTIANCASITKAAKMLYISQPSLSNYLRSVEAELGCKLFLRNNNKLILTKAGELYVEHAQKMIELEQKFNNELKDWMCSAPQKIKIGLNSVFPPCFYFGLKEAFQTELPDIQIQIMFGRALELINGMYSDDYFMAIGSKLSSNNRSKYKNLKLSNDYAVILASKDDPVCNEAFDNGLKYKLLSFASIKDKNISVRQLPSSIPSTTTKSYTDVILESIDINFEKLDRNAFSLDTPLLRVANGDCLILDLESIIKNLTGDKIECFYGHPLTTAIGVKCVYNTNMYPQSFTDKATGIVTKTIQKIMNN